MTDDIAQKQTIGLLRSIFVLAALGLILASVVASSVLHQKTDQQKRNEAQDKLNAIFIDFMQAHQDK